MKTLHIPFLIAMLAALSAGAAPPAAVHRQDRRQGLLRFRIGDVGEQARAVDSAVNDVFLKDDLVCGRRPFVLSQG